MKGIVMSADCVLTVDRVLMLCLSGLAAWLGKVWATRISGKESSALTREIEHLKANLEKRVFIHKVQFEKEFEVYLDLSKRIHAFRTAYFTLNAVLKNVPTDPEIARRKQEELQTAFVNAYTHLRDGLEEYKPFYAMQIHELAKPIIELAIDQLIFMQFPIQSNIPRYQEVQQQKKHLLASVESVVEEIRKRISSVQVRE